MRERNRSYRRFHRLAGAIGVALALPSEPAVFADARPTVEFELRIESALLAPGLAGEKSRVEAKVAAWVADALGKTLSYVHWIGRAQGRPRPVYGLVARLVDRPNTGCGTRLELTFAARVPAGEPEFPHDWVTPVGDECDLDLPRDAEGLEDRLQQIFRARLDAPFRQAIESLLTREVPLAKEVRLRDQSIGVPFSPSELRAGVDTKFRVEFSATENGANRLGNMEMLLNQAATWGGVCRVATFQFGAFSIPSLEIPGAVGWHPQFARIFAPSHLRALTIKMADYRQTLNPSGPLVDAPQSEP